MGKEKQDAQTFANWGVDYLKYDNCYNEGQEGTGLITYNRYKAMSDALNATGTIPRIPIEVWADSLRPTHSLLDVQLGAGPSLGLGTDNGQQLENEW